VPLLWRVLAHGSDRCIWRIPLLKSSVVAAKHPDVMLSDRGFANHELMGWLQASRWHYCLRLPCDVLLHGASKYPRLATSSTIREARLYRRVYGQSECIAVISSWRRFREPRNPGRWSRMSHLPCKPIVAVWLRRRIIMNSKSGAFEARRFRSTLSPP